jgi:hypothetical protein
LLQKLTQDKLAEAVAAVTAEGWKWVELRDSFDWQERSEFSQHRELTPLPADEQTLYDFLTAELDELENRMNDEEADEDEATTGSGRLPKASIRWTTAPPSTRLKSWRRAALSCFSTMTANS